MRRIDKVIQWPLQFQGRRQMNWQVPPDRYAVELAIAGLIGALVKSKAVKVSTLQSHILVPLFHHMQLHESYKEKATDPAERARHNEISIECMTWHAHMENVLNSLK
jgi:hypothetical protein